MKLLIDAGNTRLKWAFERQGELDGHGAAVHRELPVAQALSSCISPDGVEGLVEIRVASTAGPARTSGILACLEDRFGLRARRAHAAREAGGLVNGYRDPRQLGVDRWLALRAAWDLTRAPTCVVDAGTATTVDLIDGNGLHQGGLIIPGLDLMQSALRRDTGDLDRLAGSGQRASAGAVIGADGFGGRDTAAAIRLGAQRATEAVVARALASGGPTVALVVTGGDGTTLARSFGGQAILRPWLVLEGLALAGDGELDPPTP